MQQVGAKNLIGIFNANKGINSTVSQNIWDQTALFNQLTLRNILNGRNNLGTSELRAAMATMLDEQRDNALVFLECNAEELAGLSDGCGIQTVANVRNLLDYLPTVLVLTWEVLVCFSLMFLFIS